jgi:hypothetical protein
MRKSFMSVDSRPAVRGLRRSKKESDHLDYSEPDFGSWAARLADYNPVAPVAPVVVAEPEPSIFAPVVAPTVVDEVLPVATASAVRPSLESVLEQILGFDGAMSVALVDSETGMVFGKAGSGVDIELASAGASVILRSRLASIRALGSNEKIDDLLISLTSQVQIIHPLPSKPSIFTYLIADKARSSLALARYKAAEADLQIQL